MNIRGKFYWADHLLDLDFARFHSLILGVTGSGKGILQRLYMRSLVPQILRKGSNMRAFLFDPKREQIPLLVAMGVPLDLIHILHPLDARCCALDLAKDFDTVAASRELPKLLIPVKGNEAQPFFPQSARLLVNAVLQAFLKHSRGKWTLRDVILATWYRPRLEAIIRKVPNWPRFQSFFADERVFQNIKATLDVTISEFEVIAALWHNRPMLSLREWVRQSGSFMIMGSDPTLHSVLDPLNQLTFNRLAQLILSLDEIATPANRNPNIVNPYTFLALDELPSAGNLEMLSRLLKEGRSKGACLLIAFQMIYSLRELYGDNIAYEIISQCSNRAILRLADPDTAELAARWIGEEEYEEKTVGETLMPGGHEPSTSNVNYGVVRLPRILPCQLWENLPPVSEINGVRGFFFSPGLADQRTFEATIDLPNLEAKNLLVRPDVDARSFVPRPAADEILQDWTEDDLDRLGLINPLSAEESIRELLAPK